MSVRAIEKVRRPLLGGMLLFVLGVTVVDRRFGGVGVVQIKDMLNRDRLDIWGNALTETAGGRYCGVVRGRLVFRPCEQSSLEPKVRVLSPQQPKVILWGGISKKGICEHDISIG